jgi:hypothetical protein
MDIESSHTTAEAMVTRTHTIYLPTADFEDAKPGSTGRPVAKPGTFNYMTPCCKVFRDCCFNSR